MLVDRDLESVVGRDHQQGMEVKAAIAKDKRRRRRVPLIDLQVGSPDEDGKFVARSGPRLAVCPGHERRIDPLEFILHRLDDCAARTVKLRERKCHQMAGPSIAHPVDDQLGVAIHELPGDWINSADPIVFVNFPVGLCRLIRLIELVLLEFVPVGFGWIGYV